MSYPVIKAGVYVLYSDGEVVYIGESDNIYDRIGTHIREGVKNFDSFDAYETVDRKSLESFLIDAFHPKYNIKRGATDRYRDQALNEPQFLQPELSDAIQTYEEDREFISVGRVAEEIGGKNIWLMSTLYRHRADIPAWKHENAWVIDYNWYKDNKEQLEYWVYDEDEQRCWEGKTI